MVPYRFFFFLSQPNPDINKPYAYLALQIQQEPNSYETIIEIDPLDLAELFGNVGGFWGEGAETCCCCQKSKKDGRF